IVVLGMFLRNRRGGLAHAETDFEDPRCRAAEQAVQIERDRRKGYAVYGQQLGVGAALGFRNAPLAQDETSNLAPVFLQELSSYAAFGEIRPEAGELGLAEESFFRMPPARKASRPASTAFFIACAISTGLCAFATAVFMSTASQPSSMAMAASEAVPTPASTTTGTLALPMMSSRFQGLRMPMPEPISEASGMIATQPISSSRLATIGSSLVYTITLKPSRTSVSAALSVSTMFG